MRFYCVLLRNHGERFTPPWGTHLLAFRREEDREAFIAGRKSLAEIASAALGEPPPPTSGYSVKNLPRSGSEALARQAAFQVLDDDTHAAHAMERLPRSTKVYVEAEGRITEVLRQPED